MKPPYQFRHISVQDARANLEAMYAFFDERKKSDRGLVYHYTSLAAFSGILDRRAVFCTDYRFLNDKSEFRFGLDVAEWMLRVTGAEHGLSEEDILDVLEQINVVRLTGDVTVYCASWSCHGNDLSQWRAYAPQDGVSIGFDIQMLMRLVVSQGFSFSPIMYFGDSEFEEKFFAHVAQLARTLNAQKPVVVQFSDDYQGDRGVAINDLANLAVRRVNICHWIGHVCAAIKHPDFVCEQEWRVIFVDVLNGAKKMPTLKTRPSLLRAVPYIELDISHTLIDNHSLIKEINLGPSNTIDENMQIAGALMKTIGGNYSVCAFDHPLKSR